MKILIVARGVPSPEDPQWGCFEFDQAKALKALGHDIAILSVDRRLSMRFKHVGIRSKYVGGIFTINSFFGPVLFSPSINYTLRRVFARKTFKSLIKNWGEPDVIYSHYLNNTSAILPTANEHHIPTVGMEHWSELMQPSLTQDILYCGRKTYGQGGLRLLTVSDNLRKAILGKFGVDSIVIPNMLGEEFVKDISNSKFEKFTFIAVGSLIKRKGFDILLNAATQLKKVDYNSDWQILIIGDGEERTKLNNFIKGSNLENNVKLLGSLQKEEICHYMAESHAFILPSRSETFGVVYIEAMAMGLPVIATTCGIPDDLVDTSNGIVCRTESITEIAEAMEKMLQERYKYDSESIRRTCLNKFAPDIVAKLIEEQLYKAVNEETYNNRGRGHGSHHV